MNSENSGERSVLTLDSSAYLVYAVYGIKLKTNDIEKKTIQKKLTHRWNNIQMVSFETYQRFQIKFRLERGHRHQFDTSRHEIHEHSVETEYMEKRQYCW